MSTFKELQEKLTASTSKAVIYQHLVDYLETQFRPSAGAAPKKVLMTPDKVPVADVYLEQVVKELFTGLEAVNKESEQIMTMPIPAAPVSFLVSPPGVLPVPIVAPTPVQIVTPVPAPIPVVAPDPKKKSKNPQGEVQS